MNLAAFNGTNLIGHMIRIPTALKQRWANATVMASGEPVAREARIAVTVVPTFAPRVYGNTCSSVIKPAEASGTMSDVATELD
jgi:hypothetical protein